MLKLPIQLISTRIALSMPNKLYLIRHGQTDHNKNKIAQGWKNTPLNTLGREQAKKLAQSFTHQLDHIYSSDLKRAHDTALPLAKKLGHKLSLSQKLRERNLGLLESNTWDHNHTALKKITSAAFNLNTPTSNTHQGESIFDFGQRLNTFLKHLEQTHSGANIAMVTHSGTIRVLLRNLGFDLNDHRKFHIQNTSITMLEKLAQGKYSLTNFSDASHLEE